MPPFIVAADPLMRVSQRVVFREAFPLNMTVFDEHPLVLEADVLVFFDPVFAGGANRIVDVEDPDHFSFVSFRSLSDLFVLFPFAAAPGVSGSGIRLSGLFGGAAELNAAPRSGVGTFDFVTPAAPADLRHQAMTLRTFHARFSMLSLHEFFIPL